MSVLEFGIHERLNGFNEIRAIRAETGCVTPGNVMVGR